MTDTVSETEVSFEVWQDGDMVAAADSLADAEHFMLVYGQDGPVEAKTAITTRFPGFNVDTAMLAASPQGEGSSADEAVVDRMVQRFLAFGHGRFVVDTGSFHQTPAVFICPVDRPGKVGASARSLGHDRHTLLPGEMVLTFPFFQQAQAVADALVTPPQPWPCPS